MNKPCARCNRTVYPMEQLKCLDQVWHKGCFNCDFCNTKLTMKNYKGYDKKPYCNAHYPQTKFTQVADNPEIRRVKANTKITSNIQYHKDLEEQKGKKISVQSDPLIDKAMKNTKIQSNLVYHGHEKTREIENAHRPTEKNQQQGKVAYRKTSSDQQPEQCDVAMTKPEMNDVPTPAVPSNNYPPTTDEIPVVPDDPTPPADLIPPADLEPLADLKPLADLSPLADLTPPADITTNNDIPSPDLDSDQTKLHDEPDLPPSSDVNPAEPAEYNPMRDLQEAKPVGGYGHAGGYPSKGGTKYVALYDYSAADHDEVSFVEGDIIINPEIIDDGWMTGTVESTGRTGMLPSNYVDKV
ncbi:LIM and SH3 domain protein 1-like isoform X2 [Anneissia japonica]|uniref:LIM and SH3 domain protein 1-like isoform X2 n=1 Tax=Anneissia japonica TaxID=1529436 RepID=UPI001425B4C0|nr:LIM and SH3 domain protein 1-like isoform X2 [Anneissia japonica]